MESRILFNFATRGRPDRFKRAIESILNNCVHPELVTIAIKIDTDDPKIYYYEEAEFTQRGATLMYYGGSSSSKINAINRDIQDDDWQILVNVSDDQVFTEIGFDDIIRAHCGPDDFCLFPEPFADSQAAKLGKQRLAVMSIIGRDYYDRDGYVYHPSYKRTHCDEEAAEVARMRGRLKEVDINIFVHEHPAAGYKQYEDEQYLLERLTWKDDLENLTKRRKEGFPK